MRVPKYFLILASAGVAFAADSCCGDAPPPNTNQLILRNKMTEMNRPAIAPAKASQPVVDEKDAQLREALEKKLAELRAAPPPSTPAAVPAPKLAPVVAAPVPPAQPPVDEKDAQLREALEKKLAEMNQAPAPAPKPVLVVAPPAPKVVPAPKPAPAPAPVPAPKVAPVVVVPAAAPTLTAEQEAKARAALDQKMAELNPVPVAPVPTVVSAPVSSPMAAPAAATPLRQTPTSSSSGTR